MHYVLFFLLTLAQAYDEPETFNHVKFEFFYKAQFIPQEVSKRPRLPLNSLMPVIIPTDEYHIIQRANVEQGDLNYLIWLYEYHENIETEAFAWYRKLLQPGEFTLANLYNFRGASLSILPEPRQDLALLSEMSMARLRRIQYGITSSESSDNDSYWGDDFL
jgi:hypothetical protein